VELATGVAGCYAGKLLADFGADVVKVEPPEGDVVRQWGPFPGDDPAEFVDEHSALHLHLNTNKRSIVADVAQPADRELIARLIARADIVLESFRPGLLSSVGLGWETLHARHPSLVLTSITPFGQDGPYADWLGAEGRVVDAVGVQLAALDALGQPLRRAHDLLPRGVYATALSVSQIM